MDQASATDHPSVPFSMSTYLGESTVVPEVTVMGEAVSDVAELAFLDILFDWIHGLLLGNLRVVRDQGSLALGQLEKANGCN